MYKVKIVGLGLRDKKNGKVTPYQKTKQKTKEYKVKNLTTADSVWMRQET